MVFNPRDISTKLRVAGEDWRETGDALIEKIHDEMYKEMVKAAPGRNQPGPHVKGRNLLERSNKLKSLIKKVPLKTTQAGALDRRANIQVESTAAHTRFVIKGVSGRFGEGAKGKGRFFPAIGKRIRYGWYPGFKGYNFIEVAKMNVVKNLGDLVETGLNKYVRKTKNRLRS